VSEAAAAGPPLDLPRLRLAADTVRFLAADAVERAKSGHPGMPMGMADAAVVLWTRFMRWDPAAPAWPNRDRFVLSAGHGSMLLYAVLHLAGYDLPIEEIARFRQLGSRTPGHPEVGHPPGVETTTGPLGQGFGNGVGLAVASKLLAARFADATWQPATWRVFGIVSDGDLEEGVASEAASLAGHLGLGNLVYLYDDNRISIEGPTALAFSEDVGRRFEAYGWAVERAGAHDAADLAAAIQRAVDVPDRPALVICRSHIGYGAPTRQDTAAAHGEPLGADELAGAKRNLGWPETPPFRVPDDARALFAARAAANRAAREAWERNLDVWRRLDDQYRHVALWDALAEPHVPRAMVEKLVAKAPRTTGATRAHGHAVLQAAAEFVPALVGGSADLEPSTKTRIGGSPSIARGAFGGRNVHFGVREHGMGAMLNGLSLGGFIPYGATFLVFSDYARPAIRLAALMRRQVIWVMTHDSVFLGEDGPTHQPIEHLAALRAIPNLLVVRPADGIETAGAWGIALERRDGPTLIALSRQALPALDRADSFRPDHLRRGGYVLRETAAEDAVSLIATGSEVGLAVDAAARLDQAGVPARVVSMPAPQAFLSADRAWRDAVLPRGGRRVSIEAGATAGWDRVIGARGLAIGIDGFGASAPARDLAVHFGLTPEAVAGRILDWSRSGP
jgi:transketolase